MSHAPSSAGGLSLLTRIGIDAGKQLDESCTDTAWQRSTKPMSDIAGQWHQAIRGDATARDRLLRRIMPTRGR
jgi:hypothetical protein